MDYGPLLFETGDNPSRHIRSPVVSVAGEVVCVGVASVLCE